MSSSRSSRKRGGKSFSKLGEVRAFDLFYQLTFMSAMSSAGTTRSKLFQLAAGPASPCAIYFKAINTLVTEFRLDYPAACHAVGERAKSEDMKSFLLRLSDALRSGEPLSDFLPREAAVQGDNYENVYERDLESLQKWSDAFSSIIVSVALIVIIQLVSSMIYSIDVPVMAGLIATGVVMGFFGAWILSRAAPKETMTVPAAKGSPEQRRTLTYLRLFGPLAAIVGTALYLAGFERGWILIAIAVLILPVGLLGLLSDRKVNKKNEEFSTFLRSLGGMATSTGTTLKQALTKIDLSSFPTLQVDIKRLSTRLEALVDPDICWERFGIETGSQLIREATDIFYGAVRMGGDPERVGYLCSLFTAKTTQLRAKRRVVTSTFTALTLVMQGVVAGLMVFVLEVINNFIQLIETVMPAENAEMASENMAMAMSSFTPSQFNFLALMTVVMVILLAFIGSFAILASDGGFKFKMAFYLAIALLISGVSFIVVPPLVASILTI
jgi:flagellar protein FlaJ